MYETPRHSFQPPRARFFINDARRRYSDTEFVLILRKAAELAGPEESLGHASDGLTLAEIQAAAAEVGIDPALIERAARLLPASSPESRLERLTGGPVRHEREIHLPVELDEAKAARMLAAVQMTAGEPGTGQSSALGMVWHARQEMEALSVTAQPEQGGTSVTVRVNRLDTMAPMLVMGLMGLIGTATAGYALGSQVAAELGAAAAVAGVGGILGVGRAYWAASTRRVRQRISGIMDAISQAAAQSGSPASARVIGDSPETQKSG